jgi:hypothetical protein
MKKALSVIEVVMLITSFLFCAWLVISWADIVLHNTNPNPEYLSWNIFTLLFA